MPNTLGQAFGYIYRFFGSAQPPQPPQPAQTPGRTGDGHQHPRGRAPTENGAFQSAGLREGQTQRSPAAGSQARPGRRRIEKGHRQAGKGRRNFETGAGSLGKARLEETRAQKELEDAKAAATPPPPPENPPAGSVSLSSADVAGLISFFQELGDEREEGQAPSLPPRRGAPAPMGRHLHESGEGRGSSHKIGARPALLGIHAHLEFEVDPPPPPARTQEKEPTQPTQIEDSSMQDAQDR